MYGRREVESGSWGLEMGSFDDLPHLSVPHPVLLNKNSARSFDSESSSSMKRTFSFPFWFINLVIAGFSTLPAVDLGLAMIPLMGLH